jgi:hypothetical protein
VPSENSLSFANLNEALLSAFPTLRETFPEKIGDFPDWDPGQYVVFGSVFTDYITTAVSENAALRPPVGRFIERMAASLDEGIEQLLKIEVLPAILSRQAVIDSLWPHLGPQTKRLIRLLAPRASPEVVVPD